MLYIADFGQNWKNQGYSDRYNNDYRSTGEIGTFIVTDDGTPKGKELFLAHHYTLEELNDLINPNFTMETSYETIFTTFHGNETLGYVITARKSK